MPSNNFQTNYRMVPASHNPPKPGWYTVTNQEGEFILCQRYWNGNVWDGAFITHYLLPVGDSIVVTREQLHKLFRAGVDKGYNWDNPDFETVFNQLLNK